MSTGCSEREQIIEENMPPIGYDRMPSPVDCHSYEEDVEPKETSGKVTQLSIIVAEIFVDIPIQNDDFDEDDPLEKDPSLLGGEYEVSSSLFKELNWDVINVMSIENPRLSTRMRFFPTM